MLNEFGSEFNTTEYVDVQQHNVEITDINEAQEELLPKDSMPSLIVEEKQEIQTIDDPVIANNNTEKTPQNDTASQKKKKKKKNN